MYLLKPTAGKIALLLLAIALGLAACSPKAPATPESPTVDPNTIYTAAAQTVEARITQQAAMATATPEPTATEAIPTADLSLPTMALPGSEGTQEIPGQPQAVASLTPLAPIAPTQSNAVAAAPSKGFQWISNDPADGTIMVAGTKFDIAWRVKNTGTATWTTKYSYAYFSGDKFFESTRYNLKADVKPGEEVTVRVDATVPSKSGTYYTWWKLINDQGQNIGDMDVRIVSVQANETPKPTATATESVEEEVVP